MVAIDASTGRSSRAGGTPAGQPDCLSHGKRAPEAFRGGPQPAEVGHHRRRQREGDTGVFPSVRVPDAMWFERNGLIFVSTQKAMFTSFTKTTPDNIRKLKTVEDGVRGQTMGRHRFKTAQHLLDYSGFWTTPELLQRNVRTRIRLPCRERFTCSFTESERSGAWP